MARFERTFGGVIVCGGHSRRMGRPKLSLPFGPERLLQRMARIVGSVVDPVVVVAAVGQEVPPLPVGVDVLRDETPDSGPLAGMFVGLQALQDRGVEAAYVSACDVPLLQPTFIRTVLDHLGDHDVAILMDDESFHPLAAAYRTSLAEKIPSLLAADRRRVRDLLDGGRVVRIPRTALVAVDPELDSLQNANTADEYERLLARAQAAGAFGETANPE
jgi:molybdopterin-guanine dinucleotide biosynthesis protein A